MEIDYRSLPVEVDDIYMLTTDGVHDYVEDTALKKLPRRWAASTCWVRATTRHRNTCRVMPGIMFLICTRWV